MELAKYPHKAAEDPDHPGAGEHGKDRVALRSSGGEGCGGPELLLRIAVCKIIAGGKSQPVTVVDHIVAYKPPAADKKAGCGNQNTPFQPVFPVNLFLIGGQAAQGKDKDAAEQETVSVQVGHGAKAEPEAKKDAAGHVPIPFHAHQPIIYNGSTAADSHGIIIYINTHEQSLRKNGYQADKEPFAVSFKQFFAGAEDEKYGSGGKAGRDKSGSPQKLLRVCGKNTHYFHEQG